MPEAVEMSRFICGITGELVPSNQLTQYARITLFDGCYQRDSNRYQPSLCTSEVDRDVVFPKADLQLYMDEYGTEGYFLTGDVASEDCLFVCVGWKQYYSPSRIKYFTKGCSYKLYKHGRHYKNFSQQFLQHSDSCYKCSMTGKWVWHTDVVWFNNNAYHPNHTPARQIRNYSYKPRPRFLKKKWEKDTDCVGFEWETYTERDMSDALKDVSDEGFIVDIPEGSSTFEESYFKSDSSLDNGWEIVTHPMSLAYIRDQFKLRDKCDLLKSCEIMGYKNGDAGIHVHVGKKKLKPIQWWSVVIFFAKCSKWLRKFSQRSASQMNRWCIIADEDMCIQEGWNDFDTDHLRKSNTYPEFSTRGLALNFTSATCEFRLFRSTTNFDRMWANIQFCVAITDFARVHGYAFFVRYSSNVLWTEFVRWVKDSKRYKHMYDYFEARQETYM